MGLVAIIDYGSGNLRSAAKAFERVAGSRHDVAVTADPAVVARADRIVLPGQGAFAACRAGLYAVDGMVDALTHAVREKGRPFLGVCVGMQLMATRGLEHGVTPGFDWVAGEVVAIDTLDGALKVPHMGWNDMRIRAPDHPVLAGLGPAPHAYFVHSYHMRTDAADEYFADVEYGEHLAAIIGRDNMIGTQFHPEKSQRTGLRIIENFLTWTP